MTNPDKKEPGETKELSFQEIREAVLNLKQELELTDEQVEKFVKILTMWQSTEPPKETRGKNGEEFFSKKWEDLLKDIEEGLEEIEEDDNSSKIMLELKNGTFKYGTNNFYMDFDSDVMLNDDGILSLGKLGRGSKPIYLNCEHNGVWKNVCNERLKQVVHLLKVVDDRYHHGGEPASANNLAQEEMKDIIYELYEKYNIPPWFLMG